MTSSWVLRIGELTETMVMAIGRLLLNNIDIENYIGD